MSAIPCVDGQGLPRRLAPTGKRVRKPARQAATSISIPSRYRTVVYSNAEPKGFNSKVTRFPAPEINSNPGPGTYGVVHDTLEKKSVSLSTKGTGGCATLRKRFSMPRLQALGPGSYDPTPVENCRDFSQAGGTSNFRNPIANTMYDPMKQTPAPNAYTPTGLYKGGKTACATGEAVFKSKTVRTGTMIPELATHPCPTQYDVTDKTVQKTFHSYNSVFKSRSRRTPKMPEKLPGPADYYLNSPIGTMDPMTHKKGFYTYKGKNALLISAPALPRCPSPEVPGPGHYNNHTTPFQDRDTLPRPEATFRSVTGRWMSDGKVDKLQDEPGPGSYNPGLDEKRSYFYNIYRKWV